MNTWQRLGQMPEHFAVAYHDMTRGRVRAVVLEYQPQQQTWWAYERIYHDGKIPPTAEHQAIWDRLTPQERAICSLKFAVDGGERTVINLKGVKLSEALTMMEVPLDLARDADRRSPLW